MRINLGKTFFRATDVDYNYKKIVELYDKSVIEGCDLLVFSEMSIVGFPLYERVLNSEFIELSNKYIEKLVDYTKGKKTRILLGCPYFIKESVSDKVINKSELFNSMILINDGYIDAVVSRTSILKNNLFDEYKYFDNEVALKSVVYENDNFDVLIADDIMENKNILFIKERETDFIICVDTEIKKNIEEKKKQLVKIAKWTGKNVIYLNNLGYDLSQLYGFFGESFIVNSLGDIVYKNTEIEEELIRIETSVVNGRIVIESNHKKKSNENFVNILAKNYTDKVIVVEVNTKIEGDFLGNIKFITFDKKFESEEVNFIDIYDYVSRDKVKFVSDELKMAVLKILFNDCVYCSYSLDF